jgi:TolB protein
VTEDTAFINMPHYAPDGRHLTYLQGGSGGAGLIPWVMNSDGSDRSPLITHDDGATAVWGWPSWSPDGSRVLVQKNVAGMKSMWWVDLATRHLTLTPLEPNMQSPRLSPDGRDIAYWALEPNGAANVWTQSVEGGTPGRVTADDEAMSYPWWSPDGQWLAVTMKRGSVTHVGVVSRHGGPVEQLTHATEFSAPQTWSPDGEEIAFVGRRGGVWNLWTISRRTHVTRQLTHFTAPRDSIGYPSWSSDGRHMTFARDIRTGSVWAAPLR